MKVVIPGHVYELLELDPQPGLHMPWLWFVKRNSPPEKYPGNTDTNAGTNIQDVCRALIDRLIYLDHQIPCEENRRAQTLLQAVIWLLERRAARRHNRILRAFPNGIEKLPVCTSCGHIECEGHQ
jgi:hypothetical protein